MNDDAPRHKTAGEWQDHYATCPYCGYVDQDTCDYPDELSRGNSVWFSCGECARDFRVTPEYTASFLCTRREDTR